ncbi:hypothetical protein ABZ311_28560, partial [Streptomyces sp. NPDC006183]
RKADRFLPLIEGIRAEIVPAELQNNAGIVGAARVSPGGRLFRSASVPVLPPARAAATRAGGCRLFPIARGCSRSSSRLAAMSVPTTAVRSSRLAGARVRSRCRPGPG